MDRGQFTFYRSFWEAVSRFKKKEDRLSLIEAVIEYSLNRVYPNQLKPCVQEAFNKLLPQMDADWRSAADIRRSKEYAAWRTAVFERDRYTCQCCGKRGVKLNAHHIKPFAYYHDLRLDVTNGITLCERCHKEVHHGT